jgi:pterin-4a-carbinolamine dehydratase
MDRIEIPEGWKEESDSLKREFKFADFKQATRFMNKVGEFLGICVCVFVRKITS